MYLLVWLVVVGIAYTTLFVVYRKLTLKSMDRSSNISNDAITKDMNYENGFHIVYEDTSKEDLEVAKQKLIASFRRIQQMQSSKTALSELQRYQALTKAEESEDDDTDEVNSGNMIRKIAMQAKQEGENRADKEPEAKREPAETNKNDEEEPDPLKENSEVYKNFKFKMREQ